MRISDWSSDVCSSDLTAAFTLPILHRLMQFANTSASPARHPVRALILTPTRELADQVADSVTTYAKFTPLRSTGVFGGVDIDRKSVVSGKSVSVRVDLGGGRSIKKKKNINRIS